MAYAVPGKNTYRTLVDNRLVHMHPSSALFNSNCELVIYHETLTTSKVFMRIVSVCEPVWVGARRSFGFGGRQHRQQRSMPPWMPPSLGAPHHHRRRPFNFF